MEERLLRPKYTVQRINELEGPEGGHWPVGVPMLSTDPDDIDAPFVLMPRKDPAAFAAMCTYIGMCEPRLGNELRAWLKKIARSETKLGTQGTRNFSAVRERIVQDLE